MFCINKDENIEQNYRHMVTAIKNLLEDETDEIANLSNISAMINSYIADLNWVGFYIMKGGELVLGPFQGGPACIRIKVGNGVCGTTVARKETILVEDVHSFEGHIACDSATNAEIVLPIFKNGEVYGVLDLDSPILGRFSEVEAKPLQQIADLIGDFLSK